MWRRMTKSLVSLCAVLGTQRTLAGTSCRARGGAGVGVDQLDVELLEDAPQQEVDAAPQLHHLPPTARLPVSVGVVPQVCQHHLRGYVQLLKLRVRSGEVVFPSFLVPILEVVVVQPRQLGVGLLVGVPEHGPGEALLVVADGGLQLGQLVPQPGEVVAAAAVCAGPEGV